jgi:hypothetical protein
MKEIFVENFFFVDLFIFLRGRKKEWLIDLLLWQTKRRPKMKKWGPLFWSKIEQFFGRKLNYFLLENYTISGQK